MGEPEAPPAVGSVAGSDDKGDGSKTTKGGLKAGAVKFGQFLYGGPTWGYMPTC